MATKQSPFSILLPAYHIVNYHGVPMYRAQAWALEDARLHGQRFTVASGDRRPSTIKSFNKKYGTNLHDQQFLWDAYWVKHLPGYYPANPANRGTHVLRGDGVFGAAGIPLPNYNLGLDITSAGESNSCTALVNWLNAHGYSVVRPYKAGSEAHHIVFTKSPATNARKRLVAYYRKK